LDRWRNFAAQEARHKAAQIAAHCKTSSPDEHSGAKTAGKNACCSRSGFKASLSVVWRVTDHDRLRARHRELAQRHADKAWIRLSMLDVITACGLRQ
jgi:hypothetical protein